MFYEKQVATKAEERELREAEEKNEAIGKTVYSGSLKSYHQCFITFKANFCRHGNNSQAGMFYSIVIHHSQDKTL